MRQSLILEHDYELMSQAAALQDVSVLNFVLSSAHGTAAQILAEHEVITLSVDDQDHFVAELISPPAVAPALKRAAALHRDLIEKP